MAFEPIFDVTMLLRRRTKLLNWRALRMRLSRLIGMPRSVLRAARNNLAEMCALCETLHRNDLGAATKLTAEATRLFLQLYAVSLLSP